VRSRACRVGTWCEEKRYSCRTNCSEDDDPNGICVSPIVFPYFAISRNAIANWRYSYVCPNVRISKQCARNQTPICEVQFAHCEGPSRGMQVLPCGILQGGWQLCDDQTAPIMNVVDSLKVLNRSVSVLMDAVLYTSGVSACFLHVPSSGTPTGAPKSGTP
jgi:hypothetical protein